MQIRRDEKYHILRLRTLLMIIPIIEALGHYGWHTRHISLAFVRHHWTRDVVTDIDHLHPTKRLSSGQERKAIVIGALSINGSHAVSKLGNPHRASDCE
jgi:hypothetical protein